MVDYTELNSFVETKKHEHALWAYRFGAEVKRKVSPMVSTEAGLVQLYVWDNKLPYRGALLSSIGWRLRIRPDYAVENQSGPAGVFEFVRHCKLESKDIFEYPAECFRIGAMYTIVFLDDPPGVNVKTGLNRLEIEFITWPQQEAITRFLTRLCGYFEETPKSRKGVESLIDKVLHEYDERNPLQRR